MAIGGLFADIDAPFQLAVHGDAVHAAFAQKHKNAFAVGHRRVAGVAVFGDVATVRIFAIVDRKIERPKLLAVRFLKTDHPSHRFGLIDVTGHHDSVADHDRAGRSGPGQIRDPLDVSGIVPNRRHRLGRTSPRVRTEELGPILRPDVGVGNYPEADKTKAQIDDDETHSGSMG